MKLGRNFVDEFRASNKRWLIPGAIPSNSLVMVTGRPGVGKSFLIVDTLASIATDTESVLGTPDSKNTGEVVYVCLESPETMFRRIFGTFEKTGLDPRIHTLSTFDATDRAACASFAHDLNEKFTRGKVKAIAFSTFNRIAPCIDENSTQDVSMVWENLNMIRELTGATVIVEHHTALGSDRPRGSSVTDGILHTMINVSSMRGGLSITCTKQRTAERFDPIKARITDAKFSEKVGIDSYLTRMPVAYLERVGVASGSDRPAEASDSPDGTQEPQEPRDALTGNARTVLDYAERNQGVSWKEIEPLRLMSRRTFYNAVDALKRSGMLIDAGSGCYMSVDDE